MHPTSGWQRSAFSSFCPSNLRGAALCQASLARPSTSAFLLCAAESCAQLEYCFDGHPTLVLDFCCVCARAAKLCKSPAQGKSCSSAYRQGHMQSAVIVGGSLSCWFLLCERRAWATRRDPGITSLPLSFEHLTSTATSVPRCCTTRFGCFQMSVLRSAHSAMVPGPSGVLCPSLCHGRTVPM